MCNLNCRYCFYRDITKKREQSSYGLMTEETLEAVIQKGLSYAGQDCTIAFQGGEPTLAGLDFYKTVVELEKKHNKKGIRVHNAIQTNGIGLDAAWAYFFRDNNFLLRGLVRNDWFFDSLKLRCRTAAPQLFHLMQLDAYRIGSVCHSSDNSSNSNLAIGFTKQTDKLEFGGESPLTSRDERGLWSFLP